jgi:hypothetical protein
METLAQIYERYRAPDGGLHGWGDKGSVHGYIEVYEDLFREKRETARHVLEVGILNGTSLRMWEEYFYVAQVYGVDCTLEPYGYDLRPMIDEGTHHVHILDAADPVQVADFHRHLRANRTPGGPPLPPGCNPIPVLFDVVVEDASHALEQQLAIYRNLKPYLAPGAIYVVEDVADLDAHRHHFEALEPGHVTILDRRHVKGRFDDVLVVIRHP